MDDPDTLTHTHTMEKNEINIHFQPTRAACSVALRNRCENNKKPKNAVLWRNAWEIYKTESAHVIQRPKCIKCTDKNKKKKWADYNTAYKRIAVKQFLPFYRNRIQFLSGKAKQRYSDIIEFLESWRAEFPLDPLHDTSTENTVEKLQKPEPPPPIMLPAPPPHSKKLYEANGAMEVDDTTIFSISSDSEYVSESEISSRRIFSKIHF